jgi:hypothetical protein
MSCPAPSRAETFAPDPALNRACVRSGAVALNPQMGVIAACILGHGAAQRVIGARGEASGLTSVYRGCSMMWNMGSTLVRM